MQLFPIKFVYVKIILYLAISLEIMSLLIILNLEYMKKFLFLSLVALCASYACYVYASSLTPKANPGCTGEDVKACQVWYVNADGTVGMLLEKGQNITIVLPEPYE